MREYFQFLTITLLLIFSCLCPLAAGFLFLLAAMLGIVE